MEDQRDANTTTDLPVSFKSPFAESSLIDTTHIKENLPNTRGEFREQLCRTPLLPVSTKKLNMVAQLLKGMDVKQAMLQLMFMPLGHTKEILWSIKEGCEIAQKYQRVDPSKFYVGMHISSIDLWNFPSNYPY